MTRSKLKMYAKSKRTDGKILFAYVEEVSGRSERISPMILYKTNSSVQHWKQKKSDKLFDMKNILKEDFFKMHTKTNYITYLVNIEMFLNLSFS